MPLGDKVAQCPKLKVIDVSGTLAEVNALKVLVFKETLRHPVGFTTNSYYKAIRRTHNGESVS